MYNERNVKKKKMFFIFLHGRPNVRSLVKSEIRESDPIFSDHNIFTALTDDDLDYRIPLHDLDLPRQTFQGRAYLFPIKYEL